MKAISNAKLQSWIKKKYQHMIQEVDQDSEVWEVLLSEGFASVDGETMWVFGKHHYECGDYTQARIKEDLDDWLYYAEKTSL